MAATQWLVYDQFMFDKSIGLQDLDDGTFSLVLMTSAYTPDTEVDNLFITVSGSEVSGVFGYTSGGELLIQDLIKTANNIKFTANAINWTAVGGDIVARYAAIKNDITDGLVAYSLLDDTGVDVTIPNGETMSVNILVNGIYNEKRQ